MKRILFLFSIISIVLAGSPSEWKSRTIYQLFTDRFGGGTGSCGNLQNYCGGTWQGIIEHLDYIQGMGFDAIWISPIPENYPGGYHGYWQTNFEQVNSNFGTSNDLQQLIKECHSRGIWVMLDVVANHIGPVTDYSTVVPFNSTEYYHDCTPCPSGCAISDWSNQAQVEWCRLANLPDLDQSNNFVDTYLVNWIKDTVSSYGFDGIRIDTTPEVPKSFWDDYVAASGVYAVGEVFNGNIQYVASYTKPQGPLDGALSYPLFFTLRDVFANKNSMYELQNVNQQYISNFADLNLMGTFIDNHDNERFLNIQSDLSLYRNALVYVLFSSGVPIIYYGTEQGFNGGKDPNNRECLWPTQYNTQAPLYEFLSTVISYRKQAQIWTYPQVQRYADNNFYAFTRGNTFVAMTNVGSGGSQLQRTITYHPYSNGVKLCNLFYPTVDCIMVQNGSFTVYLDEGEVKIYHPV